MEIAIFKFFSFLLTSPIVIEIEIEIAIVTETYSHYYVIVYVQMNKF